MDPAQMAIESQPRFELIDEDIKSESVANSPRVLAAASSPAPFQSSSTPLPTTETGDATPPLTAPAANHKKKGMASSIKRIPKRPNNGDSKKTKRAKIQSATDTPLDGSADEESDHGPYCLCRGPDDHRWMIFCENCEDWFHGECINLNKEIGENLIEKFICPNCSDENLVTIYKKTCSMGACRKPARLGKDYQSVFCSIEHAQMWWERIVAKLPKARGKGGLSDQMTQDEFMALLSSGLSGVDEHGKWKLAKTPFANTLANVDGENGADDPLLGIATEEEKEFLDGAAKARFQLAEETLLCHKMLSLIEMVQDRRRGAINAGNFGEDMCGYDHRLDTICARDAFAAFVKGSDGEDIFKASKVSDPLGEDDPVRGMCERKRCKVHGGWQKMLPLGISHQIREMASQAAEVAEEERIVREAAGERWKRKKAEKNWVEVIDA